MCNRELRDVLKQSNEGIVGNFGLCAFFEIELIWNEIYKSRAIPRIN